MVFVKNLFLRLVEKDGGSANKAIFEILSWPLVKLASLEQVALYRHRSPLDNIPIQTEFLQIEERLDDTTIRTKTSINKTIQKKKSSCK